MFFKLILHSKVSSELMFLLNDLERSEVYDKGTGTWGGGTKLDGRRNVINEERGM